MQSNVSQIIQKDGFRSNLYHFYSSDTPKLSILILHGMAEHHKRYIPFANFLASHGIDVYLYDHRGHGSDTAIKDLGYIAKRKGYSLLIQDGIQILQHINKHKRSKALILMGHSMGSLIARNILSTYKDVDGAIICGSTAPDSIRLKSGLLFSSLLTLLYGPRHHSYLFNNILFGTKLFKSQTKRTQFDWLSRDHSSVGAYVHDPYCGFICSISFYHDLLKLADGAKKFGMKKNLNRNFPILLISGDKDAVSGYGKEIKAIYATWKNQGYQTVTMKLYEDARHELLQETNKEDVMKDILHWLEKNLTT